VRHLNTKFHRKLSSTSGDQTYEGRDTTSPLSILFTHLAQTAPDIPHHYYKRGCIQKFPDWPRGARTTNGTTLYH